MQLNRYTRLFLIDRELDRNALVTYTSMFNVITVRVNTEIIGPYSTTTPMDLRVLP